MKGDSPRHRSYLALLAGGHLLSAGLTVLVLYEVGALILGTVPFDVRLAVCAMAAGVAVLADAIAITRNSLPPGLKRQTAKSLAHNAALSWWVTPLFWGLDTGLIWSTFRVSSTSWVLLIGALLNVVPPWGGLAYGLAFTLPLIAATRLVASDQAPRLPHTRSVQAVGALILALAPATLVLP